jgi:hypothetical protein
MNPRLHPSSQRCDQLYPQDADSKHTGRPRAAACMLQPLVPRAAMHATQRAACGGLSTRIAAGLLHDAHTGVGSVERAASRRDILYTRSCGRLPSVNQPKMLQIASPRDSSCKSSLRRQSSARSDIGHVSQSSTVIVKRKQQLTRRRPRSIVLQSVLIATNEGSIKEQVP